MLGRTEVGFQDRGFEPHRGDSTVLFTPNCYAAWQVKSRVLGIGLHEISHSSIGEAPGSQSSRLRFETRTPIFFDFSLLFFHGIPIGLACESSHEYSISILIDRTFVRGGCMFSRSMFYRNMFSRNIMFSRNECFQHFVF